MNRKCVHTITIPQLITAILSVQSPTLDTPTHRQINEYVARRGLDGLSLDSCFKGHSGIEGASHVSGLEN
jgi:hypothetical protein